MGLKEWAEKKVLQGQNKQSDFMTKQINAMLDSTISKKAQRLCNEGKDITVAGLVSGWEALQKLGVTKEQVEERAASYIKKQEALVHGG
jgi:hypothetical protein